MKNKILIILQLFVLTVLFAACGSSAEDAADPNRPTPTVKSMTMGTGGTTGTYYAFGNVLSGYMNDASGIFINVVSTGGQIMPPIMGAAAFLMAEFIGVNYSHIVLRAILPAVLYFAGIFMSVHLEAKKLGLEGYFMGLLAAPFRLVAILGGLLLIYPGTVTDIAGLAVVGGLIALQAMKSKKQTA